MKQFITSFILLTNYLAFGQEIRVESDRNCEQYQIVLDFLKADSTLFKYHQVQKHRIGVSASVMNKQILPILGLELLAMEMDISKDCILSMEDDSIFSLIETHKNKYVSDTFKFTSSCLDPLLSKKRSDISVWFIRYSNDIILATTDRTDLEFGFKRPVLFLFKFDRNNQFTYTCLKPEY